MRTLESNGIFLEVNENGITMFSETTSVKKPQKDFMGAVFFFMKKNFLPANFWNSVINLEEQFNLLKKGN
jgi:hypothetical protein